MYRFLRWYKNLTPIAKGLFILAFCLFLVLLFFAVAACCGSFISAIEEIKGRHYSIWYYAFFSSKGRPATFVSYFILLIIIIISFTITYRNKVKTSDERGVHFMEDNTYGSSRWMQEDEVPYAFEVQSIEDTTTTIYGQLTEDGTAVVGWKPNEIGGTGNRNVILLASMGSGKSFGYVRTELIQAILRGDSFVVTDPSAELYTDISAFARSRGVNVKVLNLAEPTYSEFWNCIEETIDPETERLDSTRLNDFASIYMQNSGEEGDAFWYNSAQNLLKAVIGYCAYKAEQPQLNAYIALYKKVAGIAYGLDDAISNTMKNEFVSFPWCRLQIKVTAQKNGYPIGDIESLFCEIEKIKKDNPFTIGAVYDTLIHFNKIEKDLENIPDYHPAKLAYLTFQTNDTDAVRKSALQGIQLRFQLFTDTKLKEALSHDGIRLSEITLRQSAYFVIMSDKSNATKPIASLFFSFLFKDVQDTFDRNAQIAKEQKIQNPCLNLVAMLDEFFSIGVIGGSPESFGTTMSNSRKRHIYISIIVQVYSQIEALYGEQIRDVIQGGCSTLLYLGGNDPSTCEFISEFASGEATVLSETHKKLVGVLNKGTPTDLTVRSDKRFLLTVDEARRWKNEVLVVKQGEFPLKIKPFPWIQHPMYKGGYMAASSIYSTVESLEMRLSKLCLKEDSSCDYKTIVNQRISSLTPYGANPITGEILEDRLHNTVSAYTEEVEIPEDLDLFDDIQDSPPKGKRNFRLTSVPTRNENFSPLNN